MVLGKHFSSDDFEGAMWYMMVSLNNVQWTCYHDGLIFCANDEMLGLLSTA